MPKQVRRAAANLMKTTKQIFESMKEEFYYCDFKYVEVERDGKIIRKIFDNKGVINDFVFEWLIEQKVRFFVSAEINGESYIRLRENNE